MIDAYRQDGLQVRYYYQRFGSPGTARNVGAHIAEGEWLVFTDDDCLFPPEWLDTFARYLRYRPRVYGGQTVDATDNIWSKNAQMFVDFLIEWYGDTYFPTCNIAMPKELFKKVGPFPNWPTTYDRYWCWKMERAGVKSKFLPQAMIFHNRGLGKMKWRDFWNQHHKYGVGSSFFYRLTEEPFMPIMFYIEQILYPLRTLNLIEGLLNSALMLFSRIAHTAGYIHGNKNYRKVSEASLAPVRKRRR
jgi:GT2 family glycosyltransferase